MLYSIWKEVLRNLNLCPAQDNVESFFEPRSVCNRPGASPARYDAESIFSYRADTKYTAEPASSAHLVCVCVCVCCSGWARVMVFSFIRPSILIVGCVDANPPCGHEQRKSVQFYARHCFLCLYSRYNSQKNAVFPTVELTISRGLATIPN